MECSEVRELLSPASDREVAADDLHRMEEHLRDCTECALQSTMIVGLKKLLGGWDGVHASENFRSNILVYMIMPLGFFQRISYLNTEWTFRLLNGFSFYLVLY